MYLVDSVRESREDTALRLAVASPNVDPLEIICARETAVERLAQYLDHVALHRATSLVESAFRMNRITAERRVS